MIRTDKYKFTLGMEKNVVVNFDIKIYIRLLLKTPIKIVNAFL